MSRPARQFEPQVTRSGGVPSQFRFTVRCSACRWTEMYEASRPTGDEQIKDHFSTRGWLLGRSRSDDLCPSCLRSSPAGPQASYPRVAVGSSSRPALASRTADPADKRRGSTAEILARHLGKPAALAEEVFRPRSTEARAPSGAEVSQQPASASIISPRLEQALLGMAADLAGLRAAMQQATEQLGQLVALGNQQDAAVQRLAVLIEVLSGSGKREDAAGVVLSKQPLLDTSAENEGEGDVNARLDEPHAEPKPERDPQPASRSRSRKQAVPLQSQAPTARKHAVEPVLVSSIVDPKRPSRFYTSVRLSRDLWDRSGFGASDRLQIDWTGEILSIARVTEGGVKPKKVGDKVVVLQSWRLGDLNFAQAEVTAEPDRLQLKAP